MCKVPEARLCLACLRNSKEASVAGQGKVSEGRAVENEIRGGWQGKGGRWMM